MRQPLAQARFHGTPFLEHSRRSAQQLSARLVLQSMHFYAARLPLDSAARLLKLWMVEPSRSCTTGRCSTSTTAARRRPTLPSWRTETAVTWKNIYALGQLRCNLTLRPTWPPDLQSFRALQQDCSPSSSPPEQTHEVLQPMLDNIEVMCFLEPIQVLLCKREQGGGGSCKLCPFAGR